MTPVQRLHRDVDPRARRLVVLTLVAALALALGGLLVVGLRVHQVQLAYRLDALRAERARLESLLRQLEIQAATLRSPGRLAARARELGLAPPRPGQVRLAREFVPGPAGLATLGSGRVTVLERSPERGAAPGGAPTP
jgi:cell division protein FtsL